MQPEGGSANIPARTNTKSVIEFKTPIGLDRCLTGKPAFAISTKLKTKLALVVNRNCRGHGRHVADEGKYMKINSRMFPRNT